MSEVTFTNHYKAGHSYVETWADTECYCPRCGAKTVWHNTGSGDYYVDEQYICVTCAFSFHMPFTRDCTDHNDKQRLDALRAFVSAPSRHT